MSKIKKGRIVRGVVTGAVVENKKGTVTFGKQPLKDGAISVTKQVLVKDMKGMGFRCKLPSQRQRNPQMQLHHTQPRR